MKRSDSLAIIGAFAACGPRAIAAQTAAPIRVLYEPIDTATAVFAARDLGFFSRAGVAVDLQPMNTGSAMIASAVSGSVDIVLPNVLSIAIAVEKGIPIEIVAPNVVYNAKAPSTLMLVDSTSAIDTAADLNGKTIAVNVLNGLAWIAARTWIDKNGGDSKTVRFVELPFPAMPEALHAKRVDAAVIAEPALSVARPNSRVLAPVYSAISPAFPIDAWTAPAAWVNANRDAARRFATAMHDACAWANANHDKSADITASFMKLDATVIRSRTRALFAEARGFDAAAQPLLDAGVAYGVLKPTHARDLIAPGVSI
jgi:NitT/TauT family transport system substrate-binding protein